MMTTNDQDVNVNGPHPLVQAAARDPHSVEVIEGAAQARWEEPALYAQISQAVEGTISYRAARTWDKAVSDQLKLFKRQALDRKREQASKRARELHQTGAVIGAPVFELGDHAELARQAVAHMEGEYRRTGDELTYLAAEWGRLWRYQPLTGLWEQITQQRVSNLVQSWSGSPVVDEVAGQVGKLRVSAQTVRGVWDLVCDKPSSWEQGPGWLSGGPRGVAFADVFVAVRVEGAGCPAQLAFEPLCADHRAVHGFDFALDLHASAPRFEAYLQALWGGQKDYAERVALLQEVAGAALCGKASTYKRALILHGPKGTGKSTFLRILRGLFPAGSTAAVHPKDWGDDNKIAALASARLNAVEELGADVLHHHTRIKDVIDGTPVQVREVYKAAHLITPTCAHVLACNELPRIPGADPSVWDRLIVLDLLPDRSWRGSKEEIVELADQIVEQEQAGLVAWALRGAERLFSQGRYTIPESSRLAMAAWQLDADAVGLWLQDRADVWGDKALVWVNAADLFADFRKWRDQNGHGRDFNSRTFYTRLKNLGIPSRKNSSIQYRIELKSSIEYGF